MVEDIAYENNLKFLYRIRKLFVSYGLYNGRMISPSKSAYTSKYPSHLVVFNANIVIPSKGKIWFGDLDLTSDYKHLRQIANELSEPLYILRESDARFGTEHRPTSTLMGLAVWSTNSDWIPNMKNYLERRRRQEIGYQENNKE